MDKYLSSDTPITSKEDDKFQRYNFSQRIAQTIIDRESEECIVIGIYGAWGEGKTSVINFIETELKENEQIIIIKFNPWRYSDENSLLLQFFQKLATALNVSLKKKNEKVGELLYKYGKFLNIDIPHFGNIGESIQSVGELLKEVDVETLKSRISGIIRENKNKIVVFIDDIDRLDKSEINSIFRLVKLTADFLFTTYILSFDEQMVSAAIGERFGEGNQKSGQNYLEKIIQVPLKIPVAQPEALKQFCFELVDKALNTNNITISENEARRFVSEFTNSILVKLDTPRLAVRYGNTLSFAVPLPYGEVDIVDLMLIEAVKIFYPNLYEFIKLNPEYFIGAYSHRFSNGSDKEKIKQIKEHFENLTRSYTKRQAHGIQSLLKELFPRLNEALGNYSYSHESDSSWFRNKRIASSKYFNRYFTYAVIKGEVSDVAFQEMLDNITVKTESEIIEVIKELVLVSSPENFIHKLRSFETELSWEISTRLSNILSQCSNIFPSNDDDFFMMGFGSPNSQVAIFIYHLIKKHNNKDEGFHLAKELLEKAQSFEFAYELHKWFRSGEPEEKKLFNDEQLIELAALLLRRAYTEFPREPFFLDLPKYSGFLYSTWGQTDQESLNDYFNALLEEKSEYSVKLLSHFTNTIRSSGYPEPYKSNLSKEQFDYFTSIFDKEFIKKYVFKVYPEKEITLDDINWDPHNGPYQNDLNIIKQFLHWDRLVSDNPTES